ncbi:MAG: hypothetical protein J6N19_09810 [Clostridium sp.]|nr:hypothetical protein [Clostridium sp.]
MDNSRIESTLIEKKLNGYSETSARNFILPSEITVTITLDEYRTLVQNDATRKHAIDKANEDRYSREQQIKSLSDENARLKGENYDLKNKIDELNESLHTLKEASDA